MRSQRAASAVAIVLTAAVSGCGSGSKPSASSLAFSPPAGSVLPVATANAAYSQNVGVTSGGVAPFTFTLVSGPPGLALVAVDAQNTSIQGTPTSAVTGSVSIQVSDANNHVSFVSYRIEVRPAPVSTLVITPSTLPDVTRPQPYNQFLTAVGGVAPFTWSANGLPAGLTLGTSTTQTNNISGTPTTAGAASITVTVTDGSTPPQTATATYSFTVK